MNKPSCIFANSTICALIVLCLATTLSFGAVTADPSRATFTSLQQSVSIKLTSDGAPVLAKDIRTWQFLASGHDYKHMLNAEKTDGAFTIGPSKTLEVGSYDLNIETTQGSVIVQVFAPLSDLPDIVEKTAALTGQSEKKIEQKMGLLASTGREKIQIDLPPVYFEGQTLKMTLAAKPGLTCTWFMNGDLVAEGPEQNTLTYTFIKTGEYVLTYIETEKENGKITLVGSAKSYTRVVPVPAVSIEVVVNTEVAYLSPPGYKKYVWRIDGQEASTESSLKNTFKEPGIHMVECFASAPNDGPEQGFLRIRYSTNVKSL